MSNGEQLGPSAPGRRGTGSAGTAPRVALVVEGNPRTRSRLERAGVEVLAYEGRELSKGDGGPTCLTFPLLREQL